MARVDDEPGAVGQNGGDPVEVPGGAGRVEVAERVAHAPGTVEGGGGGQHRRQVPHVTDQRGDGGSATAARGSMASGAKSTAVT